MRPPLRYSDGNILLGQDGETSALYRIPTLSYPFLPLREKLRWRRKLSQLAASLQANFSMWRVERSWEVNDYVRENLPLLDRTWGHERDWVAYLRSGATRMGQMSSHAPEVYMAVSLTPAKRGGFLDSFRGSAGETGRLVSELFGLAPPRPVHERDMAALRAQEQKVLIKLMEYSLDCRRATTEELQWLSARSSLRGVREPTIDKSWQPDALWVEGAGAYRPTGAEFMRLVNAGLSEHGGTLHVDYDGERSCQALVCLGGVPEVVEFPGVEAEVLYAKVEMMQFPVDVVVHVTYVPNRKARSEARKKVIDADNNYREEMSGHHGASWHTEANREIAREHQEEIESSASPPMLKVRVSYAIGAPTKEEAESRADQLIEAYSSGFSLYKPTGLQERVWLDHLPRADTGRVRDYEQMWTTTQLGASMPVATQDVSTRTGLYIGTTTSGGHRPVFWDPTYASRSNRPPGMIVAGTLGSGKTVTTQALAYGAYKRGSLVITVDPKPDHRLHELEDFPIEVVELSGDRRFQGLLDPLRFNTVGKVDVREDVATSFIFELIRHEDEWGTAVREAVRRTLETPDPRLERVVERLQKGKAEEDRAAGRALAVWADSTGLTQLAFGGGNKRVSLGDVPGITFRYPAGGSLSFPSPATPRANYQQYERVNVAILSLVATFATQLAAEVSRHAFVLLDEAWALFATSTGRALVDRLFRLGRSQQATLCLSTQSFSDLLAEGQDTFANLVGTYMIFGLESSTEAQAGLEFLKLDSSDDELVERVMSYNNGLCLMRDVDKRVAEVQIDPADLLNRLSTTAGQLVEAGT